MHSISSVLRRLSRRHESPPAGGDAWLDAGESQALWGAVLDGGLEELELGALLASFSMAGESPAELLGLHCALAARQSRLACEAPRRAVSIPVYGLVPGEAALGVLLALFLRRFDVPVVVHGPLDSPEGPSAAALLRELGVLPSATLGDAERDLRGRGIAFVPVQLLSPALGGLVALRTRLGSINAAHLAAHALDPGVPGAVRLAMDVPGTASHRLAALLPATPGEALLLSWPESAPPCSLAYRPRIAFLSEGEETVLFEAELGDRVASPGLAGSARLVDGMRAIVERRAPAPPPLVNLAAACVHAAGAAPDFTQAKAIVALQCGRLAA
jgi:anthranilate phosphoribosyltransferase